MRGRTNGWIRTGACALLTLAIFAAGAASAGVNHREYRQRERIRAGIDDGSLTRPEARRLGHQQLRIERMEQRMRADGGGLGARERWRLGHAMNRSSARIWRSRHDGQSR